MFEQTQNPYVVAQSAESERAAFIRKTYSHLAMAVVAFAILEYALITFTNIGPAFASFLSKSPMMWLVVLGAFMAVSHVANKMAMSNTSKGVQYAGLGLFIVGEAIIFLPMLYVAVLYSPHAISQAALVTAALFLGLTAIAFTTKKDFSFLGGILKMGFLVAIGLIVCSYFFGFNLGLLFSAVMVLMAAGSILYNTSDIMYRYNPSQYVAASLGLFASVALLFWYVLRIFMSRD